MTIAQRFARASDCLGVAVLFAMIPSMAAVVVFAVMLFVVEVWL